MKKRIGFVQSGGIGDIIIALPIADHFEQLGYEVVWPIAEQIVEAFAAAKPSVRFVPVTPGDRLALLDPLDLIRENECERTIILYSYLKEQSVYDPRLTASLKFDEYKYAIAGVPFSKKWDLKIERNMKREQALFESLEIDGNYVCFHGQASVMNKPLILPMHLADGMRVVELSKRTEDESPFDWILTLERASKLILIDSCFANLVEQLNLPNKKAVILRGPDRFTPVFKNGWQFLFIDSFEQAA